MHPADYFRASAGRPARGTRPVPSEWLPWLMVELERGTVQVLDLNDNRSLHRVRLPSGRYQVSIRGYDYAGLRLVAGVRLLQPDQSAERDDGAGMLPIEGAMLGLRAAWSFPDQPDDQDMPFGVRNRCLFVQTGLGDGVYNLYHLVKDNARVGLEAEFLLPHLGYGEMEQQPRALAYYELERIMMDLQDEPEPGDHPALRGWQLELLFQEAADAFRAKDYPRVISLLSKAAEEELDRTARARLDYARKKVSSSGPGPT